MDRFLFITGAIRSQLDFNRLLVFIFALDIGFFILKTKGTKNVNRKPSDSNRTIFKRITQWK